MHPKAIIHILGVLLFFLGVSMASALGFAIHYRDGDALAILISMVITLATGLCLWRATKTEMGLGLRDGFAIVTFGWITVALFGTLPFVLAGTFDCFTDAFFETMSGFTTTGSTVLANIESTPHGILFWRSLTQWLGGMGIIVLSLAVLPILGVGGMQLFRAEVPGPAPDKLKPRVRETAKILWEVYVLISAAETVLLMLGGMPFFEALCHTFTTMPTGGFSPRGQSIGAYDSAYFDFVIAGFMFLAGTNFALHYRALRGGVKSYFKDKEFLFYGGLILTATLLVTTNVHINHYHSIAESFRRALFQVISINTTTGYTTADFEGWPYFSRFLLLTLMFIGGCAGSTGGAIKSVRILLLLKYGLAELRKLLHPQAVIPIRLGGKSVPGEVMTNILVFFLLYMVAFIVATVAMTLLGLDMVSASASVAATIGNIGPGLGSVGPMDNYAHIPAVGKWVLSGCMLLGRLEIYTVLVLLVPEFWKK